MLGEEREADTMTCQWEDCGKVFNHLPTLIEHIHNGELHFSLVHVQRRCSGDLMLAGCTSGGGTSHARVACALGYPGLATFYSGLLFSMA